MSRASLLTAFAFVPLVAVAQTAPSKAEFEVASIRAANPSDSKVEIGMHIDGSQVRFSYLSVRDCMSIAWQVKQYQIVGPDWVGSDRFNIAAKLPGPASQDQVREMLRNLLTDRFKISFHKDKKEFAVYALAPGKNGFKLKESTPDEATAEPPKSGVNISAQGSAAGVFVDLGGGSFFTFADNKLVGHKITMTRLADMLSRYMDKPVVDMTGAPENTPYDFSFAITPEDYRTMLIRSAISAGVTLPAEAMRLAEGSTESLYSAMEAAGLRMESRKTPQDVIVIDKADKTPTDN